MRSRIAAFGSKANLKFGWKSRLSRGISAPQTWIRMKQTFAISVDPLTHQIRLIHPQFILSELQQSPGDSSAGNSFQNFIHDHLTILVLILFIFVAELIFLGWFYGPSVWQYFRSREKTKGSTFTRRPQRRTETESRQTPFPDLEVETVG